ncbi:glycosyltransferase family 2 protein [Congregibacter litoralis]|nr:glycosyltransferase [Congregibacter litoralis]
MTLDILIPTFNRCSDLAKNVRLLNTLIEEEGSGLSCRILVSNNCSEDDTASTLELLQSEVQTELIVFNQTENLGGEGNVIFLLHQATAERVMIVGDDDFLPRGYLREVIRLLERSPELRAIIPGIASLYCDGNVVPERNERFDSRLYPAGHSSVRAISYLGHQISGIVFMRQGMLDAYLTEPSLRNLYPTVFFLGYSCENGQVVYLPKLKVLISQDNQKYWNYDASGLLSEIFRNYQLLYPRRPFLRLSMCLSVMIKQPTRLSFRMSPLYAVPAFFHLLFAPGVDPLVRLVLPVLFPVLYVRRIFRFLLRRIGWLR